MTKFRDLRKRLPARSTLLTAPLPLAANRKGLQYRLRRFTISTKAASAANRGILRRETLLVSEIVASPHPRLRRSCLAQVDLVLRSAILRCECKIARLMCAQKPHRGCLHHANIRPEGEGHAPFAINYGASKTTPPPFAIIT